MILFKGIVIYLDKNDLRKENKMDDISVINRNCFTCPFNIFTKSELVIYIDENDNPKILKSRYTNHN
jgi:hypothetical protein